MSVHFQVDDQAPPRLAGEGEPAPELEGLPNQPESDVVVEQWSAEEAQGMLQTVMNFGVFFYGPQWLCGPGDFLRSAPNAARLMERVFPKATTGGVVGIGIDAAAVASDFGASIAARRELLKKGPKKGEQVMAEFGLGDGQPKPQIPHDDYVPRPLPAEGAQPVVEAPATESSSFKFSPEVARALGRASNGLSELGLTT